MVSLAAKCKLVSKVGIETACQLPWTWGKDGVHYRALCRNHSWPDSSNWRLWFYRVEGFCV